MRVREIKKPLGTGESISLVTLVYKNCVLQTIDRPGECLFITPGGQKCVIALGPWCRVTQQNVYVFPMVGAVYVSISAHEKREHLPLLNCRRV